MEILKTAPKRAMAVTPHPDDCEGGCGGALAKWVKESGTVASVVMCTNGDKGTRDREMTPERLAEELIRLYHADDIPNPANRPPFDGAERAARVILGGVAAA